MDSSTFDFKTGTGTALSGHLERPTGTLVGWAVVAHCFACANDSQAASRLAGRLAQNGIGVLRFDFAGTGSGGNDGEGGFASDARDLISAVDAMSVAGMAPFLLIGHSFGGVAALSAAAALSSVNAVAVINAPSTVALFLRQFDEASLEEIEALGETQVRLGGREFVIRQSFIDELQGDKSPRQAKSLGKPLMIFHSPVDAVVGFDHGEKLYASAEQPKSFISLDNADHLLSTPGDAEFVGSMIASWATRYLDGAVSVRSTPLPSGGVSDEDLLAATYGRL